MSGLFRVPFLEDEVTTSWLSRLARANDHSPYVFCSDLGLSLIGVGRGDEEELTKLALISGEPLSSISARALRAAEKASIQLAGETFPTRMLRKGKTFFCPLCLQQDDRDAKRAPGTRRYQRVAWIFGAIQTCQVHNCSLLGLPDARGYQALDYCTRLEAVSVPDQPADSREASAFEKFLYERLSGRRDHGTLLDDLSLFTCIDLSFLLGVPASLGRGQSYRGLDQASRRVAANSGFKVLQAGERGIEVLLTDLSADRNKRSEFGGAQFYGQLYDRLAKSYAVAEFDRVREIIRQHAKRTIPMPTGTRLFGQCIETPWVTVTEVARQSGIAPSVIRKLLKADGNRAPENCLVCNEVADGLARTLNGSLTHDQAAALLEVPRGVFPRFVQAGLVTVCPPTVVPGQPASGVKTRYPGMDIRNLRQRFIEASSASLSDRMISAREASRLSKVPLTTIARLLLDGKLAAAHLEGGGSLFERIKIDPDALLRAVDQASGLSTQLAAARIGVSKVAMSRLRDKQIIPSRHIKSPRQDVYVFSEHDLRVFEGQYVSLGRLSRQWGIHRNRICQRMRELGMSSAFPREDVECHLLRRGDAERLRERM
ncbi:TniQ family protein [Ensifer sp. ENS04]|uniref:TniQ family protein n=1 Tax=Ensifer sp. ENS04 TaxID=2769281 RepID=UPI00177F9B49|nr:TniQ family protein [Ensifer sp. ENS04]MBD9538940.1 TniQ family protein [Ensifer sp. ENS04]